MLQLLLACSSNLCRAVVFRMPNELLAHETIHPPCSLPLDKAGFVPGSLLSPTPCLFLQSAWLTGTLLHPVWGLRQDSSLFGKVSNSGQESPLSSELLWVTHGMPSWRVSSAQSRELNRNARKGPKGKQAPPGFSPPSVAESAYGGANGYNLPIPSWNLLPPPL